MADKPPMHRLIAAVAILAIALITLVMLSGQPREWLDFLMDPDTHPGLFILMMSLLPLAGFPITPFLILIGSKFGAYWAAGITALIFGMHLIVSYLLAHSLFRPQIASFLAKSKYSLPEIHERRRLPFSIIFMAVPGLPYTIKNLTLATVNIPFRIYFPVALGCNLLLALPFIGLGHTVLKNP